MYIDADMLVVNDPSRLSDGIARQSNNVFNNAAFKFHDAQNPFVKRLAKDFVENYIGDEWGNQGPLLFTRVTKSFCEFQRSRFVCTLREGEDLRHEETVEFDDWGINRFYPLLWTANDILHR